MPARRSRRSSNISGGLRICSARSRSARDAITPTTRARCVADLRAIIFLTANGQRSLDVLGQNVELDIHQIARLSAIKIGMAFRERDDPCDEAFWKHFTDCEADSVEGDRTFAGHILCKLGRQLHFQSKVRAFLVEGNNARHPIDVSLHEVS